MIAPTSKLKFPPNAKVAPTSKLKSSLAANQVIVGSGLDASLRLGGFRDPKCKHPRHRYQNLELELELVVLVLAIPLLIPSAFLIR